MNQENIDKLTKLFQGVFKDETLVLTPTMTSDDVDRWDSLNHLTLISTIEESFGIKFKLKELVAMKNVGDLMELVSAKIV